MNDLSEVKGQIRQIVAQLTTVRYQMLGVQASVPPGAAETNLFDCDADPDLPMEIRTVMGTCITDSLNPMIRDLRDLLSYEPGKPDQRWEASQR